MQGKLNVSWQANKLLTYRQSRRPMWQNVGGAGRTGWLWRRGSASPWRWRRTFQHCCREGPGQSAAPTLEEFWRENKRGRQVKWPRRWTWLRRCQRSRRLWESSQSKIYTGGLFPMESMEFVGWFNHGRLHSWNPLILKKGSENICSTGNLKDQADEGNCSFVHHCSPVVIACNCHSMTTGGAQWFGWSFVFTSFRKVCYVRNFCCKSLEHTDPLQPLPIFLKTTCLA